MALSWHKKGILYLSVFAQVCKWQKLSTSARKASGFPDTKPEK